MIDLNRALVRYLRADSILTEQLGQFMGHPAIFSTEPVPEPTTTPFIVTRSVSDETLDAKVGVFREVTQDIAIYDDEDGSPADIEFIAEYIREKLRTSFSIPDWSVCGIVVNGPVINDVDELHGRVLTARITLDR